MVSPLTTGDVVGLAEVALAGWRTGSGRRVAVERDDVGAARRGTRSGSCRSRRRGEREVARSRERSRRRWGTARARRRLSVTRPAISPCGASVSSTRGHRPVGHRDHVGAVEVLRLTEGELGDDAGDREAELVRPDRHVGERERAVRVGRRLPYLVEVKVVERDEGVGYRCGAVGEPAGHRAGAGSAWAGRATKPRAAATRTAMPAANQRVRCLDMSTSAGGVPGATVRFVPCTPVSAPVGESGGGSIVALAAPLAAPVSSIGGDSSRIGPLRIAEEASPSSVYGAALLMRLGFIAPPGFESRSLRAKRPCTMVRHLRP